MELSKIKSPEMEFELPFKKNKSGDYIIFPKHISGRNSLRKLAAKKVKRGYVYLIQIDGTPYFKLGVSTVPQRRLRDIKSYIPMDIIVHTINEINDPYGFEMGILNEFKHRLHRNEWFAFEVDEAKEIMIRLHNTQVDETKKNK